MFKHILAYWIILLVFGATIYLSLHVGVRLYPDPVPSAEVVRQCHRGPLDGHELAQLSEHRRADEHARLDRVDRPQHLFRPGSALAATLFDDGADGADDDLDDRAAAPAPEVSRAQESGPHRTGGHARPTAIPCNGGQDGRLFDRRS